MKTKAKLNMKGKMNMNEKMNEYELDMNVTVHVKKNMNSWRRDEMSQ
jgi:hypothetical protein